MAEREGWTARLRRLPSAALRVAAPAARACIELAFGSVRTHLRCLALSRPTGRASWVACLRSSLQGSNLQPASPSMKKPRARRGFFMDGGEGGMDCAPAALALRCASGCCARCAGLHRARLRLGSNPFALLSLVATHGACILSRLPAFVPPGFEPPARFDIHEKPRARRGFFMDGGEGGIRTLEPGLPVNGFRDRRIRPLCHLSET